MYQEQSPRRRASNPAIARRKLARERVAPYLAELQRWRNKLLHLRALQNSRRQLPEALQVSNLQSKALKVEIEMARQAFILEMDDIRDTPAIIDYLAALDNLLLSFM